MEIYTGKSVFDGIAIGKIRYIKRKKQRIKKRKIQNIDAEIKRFDEAKWYACEHLAELQKKALRDIGEEEARIFEAHQMMLQDEDYVRHVYYVIRNMKVNAEYAVFLTGKSFVRVFDEMDDEYLKARAVDVQDVSDRVIRVLMNTPEEEIDGEEPLILVADDLTPSETLQLDKTKIMAFVTLQGSSISHTAILARTMNIPALVGVQIQESWNDKIAIVDGKEGKIIIDPETTVLEQYRSEKEAYEASKTELFELIGLPTITKSGREIKLYANIGSAEDVENVLKNDAGGIGLFRSEFLYLEKEDFPTEEEHYEAYKKVVERMEGKKVIIRTLDIRADKKLTPMDTDAREMLEAFKVQLRAIYRAAACGQVSVLFPMIVSVKEVQKIKKICEEVKETLKAEDIVYGNVELGIMIETPAAVMLSDLLAKEVDFFSVGTNDLTQYTLAVDRRNQKLDSIDDAQHPAVLRMIQMVIDNGHKEGRWVGICGELGADTTMTETFVKMGIDELSVSPALILPVRKMIREM